MRSLGLSSGKLGHARPHKFMAGRLVESILQVVTIRPGTTTKVQEVPGVSGNCLSGLGDC